MFLNFIDNKNFELHEKSYLCNDIKIKQFAIRLKAWNLKFHKKQNYANTIKIMFCNFIKTKLLKISF